MGQATMRPSDAYSQMLTQGSSSLEDIFVCKPAGYLLGLVVKIFQTTLRA